jgi:hypothetical protein
VPIRTCDPLLSLVALAAALAGRAAAPAGAATKHPRHKHKHAAKTVPSTRPAATTAAPAPAVTSVISIGGYVFYNLTYAEAVAAYQAAVAAAPAGYTPPPVTSVSATTTVGN